jgi:hypothetical protein
MGPERGHISIWALLAILAAVALVMVMTAMCLIFAWRRWGRSAENNSEGYPIEQEGNLEFVGGFFEDDENWDTKSNVAASDSDLLNSDFLTVEEGTELDL